MAVTITGASEECNAMDLRMDLRFLFSTKGKEEETKGQERKKRKEEEKGEADAAAGLQKSPKDREPPGVDAAPTNPRGSAAD